MPHFRVLAHFLASNLSTGIFVPEQNVVGDIYSVQTPTLPEPFLTFPDGTTFLVSTIPPGNAASGVCTTSGSYQGVYCFAQAGSPITLTDGLAGAQATLTFIGTLTTPNGPSPENYIGQLQATFSGTTVAQLEQGFQTAGFVDTTYSGTFVATTIPEPSSAFLGLSGLAMVAGGLFRRRRRS